MRLLNIHSLQFQEFNSDDIPPYIITSHRWFPEGEATYKDILKTKNTESRGYKKIEKFCKFVKNTEDERWSGCDWIWIDTCCIDKRSSAEVSESINSMFAWYSRARVCLAYLADVCPLSAGGKAVVSDLEQSEWFRRGWTLQELLAPSCVVFLNQEREVFGEKRSHSQTLMDVTSEHPFAWDMVLAYTEPDLSPFEEEIAIITGIPEKVLAFRNRYMTESIQERMKWAEFRKTTKPEDMAYALLGLFGVHMPLIYGEGRENAQRRLQEEIKKRLENKGSS